MRLLSTTFLLLGLLGQLCFAQVPDLREIPADHALGLPGLASDAAFGTAADIDGNQLIVGARGNNTAYLFEKIGGAWVLADSLQPAYESPCTVWAENSLTCSTRFSLKSVAIYGDYALVGGGEMIRTFAPSANLIACDAPNIAGDSVSRRSYSVLYQRTAQGWQMAQFIEGHEVNMNNGVIASQGTIYYGFDSYSTLDCSSLRCYDDGLCGGHHTFLYRLTNGQWQKEYEESAVNDTWWYDYRLRLSLSQSGNEVAMLAYESDYAPYGIGVLRYRNGAWQRVQGSLYAVEGERGIYEVPFESPRSEGLNRCDFDGTGYGTCQTFYNESTTHYPWYTYTRKRYDDIDNALVGAHILLGEPNLQQVKVLQNVGDSIAFHSELVPSPNTGRQGFGRRIYHDGTQVALTAPGSNRVYVYDDPFGCTLPTEWTQHTIGIPSAEACYDKGTFTLTQGGSGLAQQGDQVQFVAQPLSGAGQMVLHISDIPVGSGGSIGLMLRESTDPQSQMVFTGQSGTNDLFSGRYRHSLGTGYCPYSFRQRGVWFKLLRYGNWVSAYRSVDGVSWHMISGRNLRNLPSELLWGIAATGTGGGQAVQLSVDSVSLTSLGTHKTAPAAPTPSEALIQVYPQASYLLVQAIGQQPADGDVSLRLFNMSGQTLYQHTWQPALNGLSELQVPFGHLPQGIYVLRIAQGAESKTYTFRR